MNWINIECTTLDSEEFLGAEPIERATWLCLLRYCVGQENGGRIAGAREWKDRKWQQVVRVTAREITSQCDLWVWDGNDLLVSFYPSEKEEEVRRNRENGQRGGRPRKPKQKPIQNHPVSSGLTETVTTPETPRFDSAETERKGRERKGKELSPLPPPGALKHGESTRGAFDDLTARINALRPEWSKPSTWSYNEQEALFNGAAKQLEETSEDDWELLGSFLNAFIPDAKAYFQPRSRSMFVRSFADVFASAQRWQSKPGNGPAPKTRDTRW